MKRKINIYYITTPDPKAFAQKTNDRINKGKLGIGGIRRTLYNEPLGKVQADAIGYNIVRVKRLSGICFDQLCGLIDETPETFFRVR